MNQGVTIAVGVGGLVVGLGIGFGIGAAVFAGGDGHAPSAANTRAPYVPITTSSSAAEPDMPPPSPTDFAVDIAVTEQKCFGSAGCSYELSVTPRYLGFSDFGDGANYLVTYEILGGEDPQTGNFRIEGDNMRWDQEKRISGDQGANFTARVTQVLEQY